MRHGEKDATFGGIFFCFSITGVKGRKRSHHHFNFTIDI